MAISEPGIYDMPAAEYHADCCPEPSLSSSLARVLLAQSPWHSWQASPRLNPGYVAEESERFDIGTAIHSLLLEGESDFVIIDAADWRKKDAQAARDQARAEGRTPLLARQWADVQAMAETARRQFAAHEERPQPFANGKPEQTLIWREEDVWCRARLDWLADDYRTIDDLKSTAASANPDAWGRLLWSSGYDVQAAFYLRGLRALTGIDARFRFVPIEVDPPYALSVIGLAPDALALAERKVARAIGLWRECLNANAWPGYPNRCCYVEAPPWIEAQWTEREWRDRSDLSVTDDGRPIDEQLMGR